MMWAYSWKKNASSFAKRKMFYYLWLKKSWRQSTRKWENLLAKYPSLHGHLPLAIPADSTLGQSGLGDFYLLINPAKNLLLHSTRESYFVTSGSKLFEKSNTSTISALAKWLLNPSCWAGDTTIKCLMQHFCLHWTTEYKNPNANPRSSPLTRSCPAITQLSSLEGTSRII